MSFVAIGRDYVRWHYTRAFRDLWDLWQNFLWFFYHFFSLPVLVKTFFAPWQRLEEHATKRLDFAEWSGVFIVNAIMRAVGVLMRSVLLIVGVIVLGLTVIVGLLSFALWTLLPLVLLLLIGVGVKAIL